MPEVSQKKIDRMKALAKRGAMHIAAGGKGTVMMGAAGAAALAGADAIAPKVPFIKDQWYGKGAVMLAAGHFVRRKNAAFGAAICGAAGAELYRAYEARPKEAKGIDAPSSDAGALIDNVSRAAQQIGQAAAQMSAVAASLPTPNAGALMQGSMPADAGAWADFEEASSF